MLGLQTKSSQPKRPNTKQHTLFDATPLWSYVAVMKPPQRGSGYRVLLYNYCNKQVTRSYTKVKGRLLHLKGRGTDPCNIISNQTREGLAREHEAVENQKSRHALEAKRK